MGDRVIPLTVTAHLSSACAPGGPLLFDGILCGGLGGWKGARLPSGLAGLREVQEESMGLAWCGRWWAASAALPQGPEEMNYGNRRPAYDLIRRWTTEKSVNFSAGPDKALHVQVFSRPGWMSISWYCVGDPERISQILPYVQGVGQRTTHGYGWVDRWEIRRGGPALSDFSRSLDLRHLPLAEHPTPDGKNRRVLLPLTPPYHDRSRAVECWQRA